MTPPLTSSSGMEGVGTVRFAICAVCQGEFDEGEWDADSRCPECESPKQRAGTRIASFQPKAPSL